MTAPPTRSSPTVFVVYAGPDAPVAGQLTAALNAAGIGATYDKDLLPGDIWDVELPRLLGVAPVVAVLISSSWQVGWYSKAEVARAIEQVRASDGAKRIVPVLLGADAKAHVPYGLERLVSVSLADGEPASIARAVDAFRRLLDGQPPPPEPEPEPEPTRPPWWVGLVALAVAAAIAWVAIPPDDEREGIAPDAGLIDAAVDAYALPPPIPPFDGGPPDPRRPYRPAAVWLPAARAPLGRPADAGPKPHASPMRTADIPAPLWAMVTPVTRAHYREVMGALPECPSLLGAAPPPAPDEAPVVCVTVEEAEAYARRISARDALEAPHHWRLPTEDEWEYICRAGGPTDDAGPVEPKRAALPRVGNAPNAWQVRDLLGVVQQWTATPWPPGTADRGHRGGHHGTTHRITLRCSYRGFGPPTARDRFTGFRLVRTAE